MAIQGGKFMPFGTPGGDVQTQAMLQTLLNSGGLGDGRAGGGGGTTLRQLQLPLQRSSRTAEHPGLLRLGGSDGARPPATSWPQLGHKVEWWPDMTWLAGSMGLIVDDRDSGFKSAAADPRRMAFAAGS